MLPEMATNVWFDKPKYDEAETRYYLYLQKKNYGIDIKATPVPRLTSATSQSAKGTLASQIAEARQQIKDSLQSVSNDSNDTEAGAANLCTPSQQEQQVSTASAVESAADKKQQPQQQQQSKVAGGGVLKHAPGCPCAAPKPPPPTAPTQEPIPMSARKKRKRNRNRSRRNRSKSVRAASVCSCRSDASPGRVSVASANISLPPSNSAGDTMTGATTQQVEDLKKTVDKLVEALKKVELRMSELESKCSCGAANKGAAPKAAPAPAKAAEDDDIDLFGSDEDEEANKVREERLKQYAEKKAKKPGPIAKSSIVLDVKPWDDETDLGEMEKHVRSVEMDGLIWGTSKLVPLAFGIKKLQIVCVVEDDKVSIDELTEKIQEFEDFVQSVDIAAFNKI